MAMARQGGKEARVSTIKKSAGAVNTPAVFFPLARGEVNQYILLCDCCGRHRGRAGSRPFPSFL